jgi:hypothetical protein
MKRFFIGVDNRKALAMDNSLIAPVLSGHNFSFSGMTFWNEARSQYPKNFNKVSSLLFI